MLNFIYHIPTKVYFGRGELSALPDALRAYGSRVMIVTYKSTSAAEDSIIHQVTALLDEAKLSYLLFNQVEPNPLITTVESGAALCKQNNIQILLGIGGGSAIDCAKAIAAAACYDGPPWELILDNSKVTAALPVGSILTIAAAGSEMDYTAVISNDKTKEKLHLFSEYIRPRFAILDPVFTYSVPYFQTAAGCADILSHAMEVYFSNTPDTYVQNRMAEAMMKTVIHYADTALKEPDNYEARANLMWTSTLTISSMLAHGKQIQWSTHYIEHTISAFYNVPHGAGVAVILPHWMEYVLDSDTVGNFVDFAENVWGVSPFIPDFHKARAGIQALRYFLFHTLHLPSTLRELGVEQHMLERLAESAVGEGPIKGTKTLLKGDVLQILKSAY